MNSAEKLEEVLKKTGLPVKYYEYGGTKQEYIIYNEEAEESTNHGDNRPLNNIVWWQVHIFAPKDSEFRAYKNKTRTELLKAGYMVTDIVTLYEKETKTIHVVISCHIGEMEV